MSDIRELLRSYWGYEDFRPLQEEIIRSVISGRDTLALLPTGGGKSLTYQISGLFLGGTTLVITPLIALMKDQVESLKARDIAAEAIYTGMDREHIASVINKSINGGMAFLYISPERLISEYFRLKLRQIAVSLIAVDEAHCISQWGYDFRPSYLRIAEIREWFPKIPLLALTATATPDVVKDIQKQLGFKTPHVLQSSFKRENLSYVVRECEDKPAELIHILKRMGGSSIIYVRKRRTAEELSTLLNSAGVQSGFYHAALSSYQRAVRQERWMRGEVPVIVATNAFGMGIDKPDVRTVIHFDIPDAPEAYFQEAGRAGRDGVCSYAILLYSKANLRSMEERISKSFPDKDYVKQVYAALSDHFQIGEGGGKGRVFEFNVDNFCADFKLERVKVLSSINILEISGYIECTTDVNSRSRVMIVVLRDQLYNIELGSQQLDRLLTILMRYYAGIFVQSVVIDEEFIANELEVSRDELYELFLTLSKRRIIRYVPGNDNPYIIYLEPRFPLSYIRLPKVAYEDRKKKFERRIGAMIEYIATCEKCRQIWLSEYFGQKEKKSCGICDICLQNKRRQKGLPGKKIRESLLKLLSEQNYDLNELTNIVGGEQEDVIRVIRRLLDEDKIHYVEHTTLEIKSIDRKRDGQ